jgi:hypothetical protein
MAPERVSVAESSRERETPKSASFAASFVAARKQNIARFDVAVHDAARAQLGDRGEDRQQDVDGPCER